MFAARIAPPVMFWCGRHGCRSCPLQSRKITGSESVRVWVAPCARLAWEMVPHGRHDPAFEAVTGGQYVAEWWRATVPCTPPWHASVPLERGWHCVRRPMVPAGGRPRIGDVVLSAPQPNVLFTHDGSTVSPLLVSPAVLKYQRQCLRRIAQRHHPLKRAADDTSDSAL